jgi:type II secretory pathway pseudopilin PulG
MAAAAHPLSIAVHANQLDAVEEMCTAALGCAQTDLLGQLLLLVVFGLVTVFVLAAAQQVREARSELSQERSRTATEREAFAQFARRVTGVEPSTSTYQLASTDGAVSATAVAMPPPSDGRLEAVREAYRQTVMSMRHYDEEYGEPMARHLREEFGEEVATAVADGDQLTPELKAVLVERAREAARDRERLIHRLDHEADALEAADDELHAIGARQAQVAEDQFGVPGLD